MADGAELPGPPTPAACGAATSAISRWRPDAWSSPPRCGARFWRSGRSGGGGAARLAAGRLSEGRPAPAGDDGAGSTRKSSDQDQAVYLVVEPADPFTEAVRTALEIGAEVVFAEPDADERPHLPGAYPDSYSVRHIGAGRYIEAYRLYPQPRTEESAEHASGIAWKLQGTDPGAAVFVVVSLNLLDGVLEAMEEPQPEPPRRRGRTVDLLNPHPACLAEITFEYPFLQERYERFRERLEPEELADRRKSQWVLLKEAEVAYEANTGEKVAHWQRRMMARYSRNLAGISSQLVPISTT